MIALIISGYFGIGTVAAAIAKHRFDSDEWDGWDDWPESIAIGVFWPLAAIAAAFFVTARHVYWKLYPEPAEEDDHADVP